MALDSLAEACAKASIEMDDIQEEFDAALKGEEDEEEEDNYWFSRSLKFGIVGDKLYQTRCCSSQHLCSMDNSSINTILRCEACGFCCHRSCQVALDPKIDGLKYNRICKYCASRLEAKDRNKVDSNNEDIRDFISLNHRGMDISIVSQKELIQLKQNCDDGLEDIIDESESEEDNDDDVSNFGSRKSINWIWVA